MSRDHFDSTSHNNPLECHHLHTHFTGYSFASEKLTRWYCEDCDSLIWFDPDRRIVRILPMRDIDRESEKGE